MSEDHPRVCGKDDTSSWRHHTAAGSPPRMRERPFAQCTHKTHIRITPAYAGKTHLVSVEITAYRDHPRVCGKDLRRLIKLRGKRGSPPRMRERRRLTIANRASIGITPAYAGKTGAKGEFSFRPWDHPRVCGKDLLSVVRRVRRWGSPPRMRERLRVPVPYHVRYGITPAYAGKTPLFFSVSI